MKISTDKKKIEELLSRGVEEIIEKDQFVKELKDGKQLRIKLGIDPTSPNIHIGRSIPLFKLRDFQELGHKIILIIGDFTGVIGDTSDKESERPMMAENQVKQNMKNYVEQAGKIIDIEKCEVHYNSEWLTKLGYYEIGEQADVFSLNGFISRENIKKRLDEGRRVSLRELLYPLMQGYDSVAIKADVEIGGTDQRFNLLAGRELQRHYGQKPQNIITNPLIEGLDGRKMSSSWGNTINLLDSAGEMYGKIMSLKDELITKYFILATRVSLDKIEEYEKEIGTGGNPRDYKMKLAFEIVKIYHGEKKAKEAAGEFERVFTKKELPDDIIAVLLTEGSYDIIDLLLKTALVKSKSEARRLVLERAVKIDGVMIEDPQAKIEIISGLVIQVGKRRFARIKAK
ncbi:tyrosine--tRNA ligase [Patescibacteria group bacterium]|nr:tyrosine--tRNA ligase [Patescibacteria group bacterium]